MLFSFSHCYLEHLIKPHTNSMGVLLDNYRDGIPDGVESWFSNVSIVKSGSYRQAFKSKFGTELFNQYSWIFITNLFGASSIIVYTQG